MVLSRLEIVIVKTDGSIIKYVPSTARLHAADELPPAAGELPADGRLPPVQAPLHPPQDRGHAAGGLPPGDHPQLG